MIIAKFISFILLGLLGGCDSSQEIDAALTHAGRHESKVRLPCGVEFEVLNEPSAFARMPSVATEVKVNCAGWLDVAGKPGQGIEQGTKIGMLGCGQILKGIEEGVYTMRIGEKRRLYIPGYLAFGKNGVKDKVPADAAVIYDVELLDF